MENPILDDYLLDAYKTYLEREEWPNYSPRSPIFCCRAGWRDSTTPMLIGESVRIIVNWNADDKKLSVTPINMPNTPIKVTEIIGTILKLDESHYFVEIDVYDGTGIAKVKYERLKYEKDKRRREAIDSHYRITEDVINNAPRVMKRNISGRDSSEEWIQRTRRFQIDHEQWWSSTGNGLYGKQLEIGDYVNVFGFWVPKYTSTTSDGASLNCGVLPQNIFIAVHVDIIDQKNYEEKLIKLVDRRVMRKYFPDAMTNSDERSVKSLTVIKKLFGG